MRIWNLIKVFMILLIYAILSVQSATKVSPKLDFGEASDLVTVNKDGIKGTRIKSLKVTVDTSESRGSPESKSSNSDSSSSSADSVERQTVGVRTDVTFEITNETNDTKTVDDKIEDEKKKKKDKEKDDGEDANVPIFKGTGGESSTETANPNNIYIVKEDGPIFHKTDDQEDYWSKFLPKTVIWTTERNPKPYDVRNQYHHRGSEDYYRRRFIPYTIGQGWRPCYCEEYRPYIKPQEDPIAHRSVGVDNKLDAPFNQNSP